MHYLHTLLLAPVALAAVLLRDDWDSKVDTWVKDTNPPSELAEAFRRVGAQTELTLASYTQPNQYVKVIFSPGDSYTAGIGSDGPGYWYEDSGHLDEDPPGCVTRYSRAWPEWLRDRAGWDELQGAGWRKNNFGACSGAVINDIIEKQLEPGENRDEDKFKEVGEGYTAPQLAVLTAGGNDAHFGQIVEYCIYRWDTSKTCEEVLKPIEKDIAEQKDTWKKNLHRLWAQIIAVGRAAKGAEPPESFQIYQGGYIPFWNEDDTICDKISWSFNFRSRQYLTTSFRKRLNDLTRNLNDIIREAAEEYKDQGVTYVDSYIDKFDTHRYCDPTGYGKYYDEDVHGVWTQDYTRHTWFWSIWNKYNDQDNEGPDHPFDKDILEQNKKMNITQAVYDHLIPNKTEQAQIDEDTPPSKFNPVFADPIAFHKALQDMKVKDSNGNDVSEEWQKNDGWWRVFHPKGTALEAMADSFFDAIKANRKWDFNKDEVVQGPGGGQLTCNGLKDDTNTYITRDTLNDIIVNSHCPKLKGATSELGVGLYLGETPEAVEINVNGDISAEGSPSVDDCIKNLQKVLDGCHDDGDKNPLNWRAGGEYKDGSWTYSIRLLHDRPVPYVRKPQAWCQLDACDEEKGCEIRIWGAGWESSNFGAGLRKEFEELQKILEVEGKMGDKDAGVVTSDWGERFRYGLKDGHEWTTGLQIDSGIFAGDPAAMVPAVLRTAAKPKDEDYLQINDLVDGKCKVL